MGAVEAAASRGEDLLDAYMAALTSATETNHSSTWGGVERSSSGSGSGDTPTNTNVKRFRDETHQAAFQCSRPPRVSRKTASGRGITMTLATGASISVSSSATPSSRKAPLASVAALDSLDSDESE